MSLSTTRELCAVAGAQDVVRDHIALFGMFLYVYSEGVETIIRSVSYLNFRAPRDRAPPYGGFLERNKMTKEKKEMQGNISLFT